MAKPRQKFDSPGTRRALLDRLKRAGPQDAEGLGAHLGVTAMAVRQHLYALEAEGIVAAREAPRPLGRPVKLWALSDNAEAFFPDGHAELTLGLLSAMGEAFGPSGLDRLLAVRTQAQGRAYAVRVHRHKTLKRRLEALAEIRSEEGYMAEVRKDGRDTYLFVENHCPVCAAARVCQGLCRGELELFRAVLGPQVTVERIDHILAGARRCSYRVSSKTA